MNEEEAVTLHRSLECTALQPPSANVVVGSVTRAYFSGSLARIPYRGSAIGIPYSGSSAGSPSNGTGAQLTLEDSSKALFFPLPTHTHSHQKLPGPAAASQRAQLPQLHPVPVALAPFLSMASEEAEPLHYTTTVLRVSIHCEGCKKKVRKVLLAIEGVYKVTIDAAQHKVTVTGSVAADALVRRLLKSGKQAALWPVPAPAPAPAEHKKEKGEKVVYEPSAGKKGKGADKAVEEAPPESSEKKPEKDKGSAKKPEEDKVSEKKAEKTEAKKPTDDAKEKEVPEKEKGSPEPAAKEANAEEAGGEKTGGKKGKKKNKQKDAGGDGDAAAEKPPPPPQQQQQKTKPQPLQEKAMTPVPAPAPGPGSDRPHGGGFPYYAPQPVMSYNMAHPSASVSYYAPMPVASMQPMPPPPPPHMPYGYSPYPPMMMPPPPPEFMYGPPGMRSSPPQESYNNMFNEENPNSCSLM
ncbi:hypothetical protein ACQ4PT_043326 [Festuca glaucescens]